MAQGKINRGRQTDHPAGRHSIRTNQCPPPPSPPHIASAHWTTNLNNTVSDAIVTYYMGMWTNGNGITHTKKVTPQ